MCLIVSLCLYFTVKNDLNVDELLASELPSPRLLLLENTVQKNSSGSEALVGEEIDKLPASQQLEHSVVEKNGGSNEILVCQRQTNQIKNQLKSKFMLPQYVINHDHVKTFVFFLGHSHSGHSIIGSLMDSHPHMVISHEVGIFRKLSEGAITPNKKVIFNAIWKMLCRL